MTKSEKRTTIKGVPPKILLGQRDANTDFYGFASHGQVFASGTNPIFDDRTVLTFNTAAIYYSLGLPVTGTYSASLPYLTSSLIGQGIVRAGIGDSWLTFSSSIPYEPFRDSDQFAADGKSNNSVFWATGSNIEGFEAPVWSKNKIEIDFTPVTASSLTGSRYFSGAHTTSYMGYYNFEQKRWNQLIATWTLQPGSEDGFGVPFYSEQMKGFSSSHNTHYSKVAGFPKTYMNAGRPVSSLGFPFSDAYNATSSFQLPMSRYIDRPFVVEKIVLEMSAAFRLSTLPGTLDETFDINSDPFYANGDSHISSSYVVNNFFILNQRNAPSTKNLELFIEDAQSGGIRRNLVYSSSLTTRDLVTWFEIASFNNDYGHVYTASLYPEYFLRDYTIINSSSTASTTSSWARNMIISGTVRSPKASSLYGSPDEARLAQNTMIDTFLKNEGLFTDFLPIGWFGSRNGLLPTNVSGRDLLNPAINFKADSSFLSLDGRSVQIGSSSKDWVRDNPYILLPGDNLILGWQLPTMDALDYALNNDMLTPSSSFIDFPVSPAKIVFYGSFLSEGSGVNDTTSQNLGSSAIHEVIE